MKPSLQEEIRTQNSGTTTTTTRAKPSSSSNTKQQQQEQHQEEVLKCPRCDSSNTKFCYYNNYSLTQPRHFCKTCRRYWTKGGALRNVPIGGGCRKSKKFKSSSSSCSSPSCNNINSSKFFVTPSIDFQLSNNTSLGLGGAAGGLSSFPRSCFSLDHLDQTSPTNLNYSSFMGNNNNNFPLNLQVDNNNNLNLASSIESLSSLNQDLHWKLQQQRLAMVFGNDHHHHQEEMQNKDQNQKFLQPILFQNLEIPKQDNNDSCCFNNHHPTKECASSTTGDAAAAAATTEWFFGNNNSSYDHHQVMSTTNISRNIIGGNSIAGGSSWNSNNNNGGVQEAWEDLHHFTALP